MTDFAENAENALLVEIGQRRIRLTPGEQLTFGRDRSCTVCLDATDAGISRIAGRIDHADGVWAVTNLSRKRALHIADANGFAVPLPIGTADGMPSRRVVDQPVLTVLIAGEQWTHALALRLAQPRPVPAQGTVTPLDPISTRTQMPRLTDRRREGWPPWPAATCARTRTTIPGRTPIRRSRSCWGCRSPR
jgi:hypothetical protein